MYLTYTEYLSYGGTLEVAAFNNFEYQAEVAVDYVTFNRLHDQKAYPERVKRLVYHLIGLLVEKQETLTLGATEDGANGAHITSQSNDGVSISYNGMSTTDLHQLCEKELKTVISVYLAGVKNEAGQLVLYRGLYRNE